MDHLRRLADPAERGQKKRKQDRDDSDYGQQLDESEGVCEAVDVRGPARAVSPLGTAAHPIARRLNMHHSPTITAAGNPSITHWDGRAGDNLEPRRNGAILENFENCVGCGVNLGKEESDRCRLENLRSVTTAARLLSAGIASVRTTVVEVR